MGKVKDKLECCITKMYKYRTTPKKQKIKPESLVGKSRREIIALMGDKFVSYHEDMWHYTISKNIFGRKKVLSIEFENDIVIYKSVMIIYGNLMKIKIMLPRL